MQLSQYVTEASAQILDVANVKFIEESQQIREEKFIAEIKEIIPQIIVNIADDGKTYLDAVIYRRIWILYNRYIDVANMFEISVGNKQSNKQNSVGGNKQNGVNANEEYFESNDYAKIVRNEVLYNYEDILAVFRRHNDEIVGFYGGIDLCGNRYVSEDYRLMKKRYDEHKATRRKTMLAAHNEAVKYRTEAKTINSCAIFHYLVNILRYRYGFKATVSNVVFLIRYINEKFIGNKAITNREARRSFLIMVNRAEENATAIKSAFNTNIDKIDALFVWMRDSFDYSTNNGNLFKYYARLLRDYNNSI